MAFTNKLTHETNVQLFWVNKNKIIIKLRNPCSLYPPSSKMHYALFMLVNFYRPVLSQQKSLLELKYLFKLYKTKIKNI